MKQNCGIQILVRVCVENYKNVDQGDILVHIPAGKFKRKKNFKKILLACLINNFSPNLQL